MTYRPTDHEKALYSWLKEVVGADVEVRFAMQAAPRADEPFVTLQVISAQNIQTPMAELTDSLLNTTPNLYKTAMHEHRGATVSVNVYGAQHRDIIAAIERSLFDPHIVGLSRKNGISVQRALSGAQDLTALIASDYAGRSQQDFGCEIGRAHV